MSVSVFLKKVYYDQLDRSQIEKSPIPQTGSLIAANHSTTISYYCSYAIAVP